MLLGVLFVYSATMINESALSAPIYKQKWVLQIVWYLLGLAAAAVVCLINYQTLARWGTVAYWCGVGLLALVLIFGTVRFGARRWFDLRFFLFQPSEFAKLAFILAQANFLSRPADELRDPLVFWKAIGMMLLPFVLILKEPDLGSALVLLPTGLVMLFVAGTPKKYLIRLTAGIGILAVFFLVDALFAPPGWWQIKLENYQRQRLQVYFGADFATRNASPADRAAAHHLQSEKSYQVRQALRTSGAPEPLEVERPSGTDIWSAVLGNSTGKLQVRVGVAAKDVASYVNDQSGVLNRGTFLADMSSGFVYAMMPSDDVDEAKKWLERLRQPALAIDGYAVVMDMPGTWQGVIERWGYRPQAVDLMRGLKERWDPRSVLNPGVFIL